MGFLPKNLFSKKQESPILEPSPEPTIQKPKSRSTRSRNSQTTTSSSSMQTTIINGHAIRVFSYENQQYYCIDDLAKNSKITNPEQFLKDFLTKNPELNNDLAEVEAEEDGRKITLLFATKVA